MHFVSPAQLPLPHALPFPPAWILSLVVEGFGPSLAVFPPLSLLPPPASLGFSFDTSL